MKELSSLLFNIVLDNFMGRSSCKHKRIIHDHNRRLVELNYADYICLLSHSYNDMQAKLNKTSSEAAKIQVKIKIAKTKAMRINATNNVTLTINEKNLGDVSTFYYHEIILAT